MLDDQNLKTIEKLHNIIISEQALTNDNSSRAPPNTPLQPELPRQMLLNLQIKTHFLDQLAYWYQDFACHHLLRENAVEIQTK
mmetsp:Transcript_16128/g.34870  ORF Transcript_16128/g.34870 Transcript_16128/m.34870 type:complete len:83 (-) Transcript_16128:58-306(-)